MLNKTVDQLISDVVAMINVPISQGTYSTQQIADYLDQEMRSAVVPLVKSCREEYFVITTSLAVDRTTSRLAIPSQAAGFSLRDIYFYDQNGNFVSKVNRINPDEIPYMGNYGIGVGVGLFGIPTYYVENNEIVFYPALTQAYTCKMRYFKAPNHLNPYEACTSQVLAKLGSNQLQMGDLPTGDAAVADWVTNYATTTLDVITQNAPFNFRPSVTTGLPLINQSIQAPPSYNVLTVTTDCFNSVQVGDYICTNDTCGFVQFLPFEAYQLIKLRAAMYILNAQGDLQTMGVMGQLYNAAADDFTKLITPKVDNMPRKIRPGKLLGRSSRGRW